jgi:ADP-ribosylglycohydrolase
MKSRNWLHERREERTDDAVTKLPADYEARVYAGWLGKCVGVRFGAPLENWTYDEILDNLGELDWYVREDSGKIFKPDDDTAMSMIEIRALEDNGVPHDLTPQQVADTSLNYLGDQHGTLWWGGYGTSTEHTAYVNYSSGIPAPQSGSIALNGAVLAEQIGGQIFSDVWGLVAPNNPAHAARLAASCSSVSHDGNAIYGGRFIASLVSAAFSERDPHKLIEIGLAQIPVDSTYTRVIQAMRNCYADNPNDWRAAYAHLKANFGPDRYPGAVHVIPNAGVVAIGLLYGEGDFSRSIRITNMAGWDTDCNVGNVGAILGVAAGLDGIDSRWREPMNDLLIAASIIGTRNILTIPQCVDLFVRLGRALAGESEQPARPRYHFCYPGSTSNFEADGVRGRPIHLQHAQVEGRSVLRTAIRKLTKKGEIRIFTRTYYRPSELSSNYYEATFTPLIAPGQTVTAQVFVPADAPDDLKAALYVHDLNQGQAHQAEALSFIPGQWHDLTFTIPALTDACLSQVGVVLRNVGEVWTTGSFSIAALTWDGTPDYTTTFAKERPESGGISQWTRLRGYWRLENGDYHGSGPGHNETYSGDINWQDYTARVELVPLIGDYHNVQVRVRGALYSYAFGLAPNGRVTLYKKDHDYHEVASVPFSWQHGEAVHLIVTVQGSRLTAFAENNRRSETIEWADNESAYTSGQIGLSVWHGSRAAFKRVQISPVMTED